MYLHIVWSVSPFVSGTVHQPGHVQNPRPTEHGSNEPSICPGFTPAVDGNTGWNQEAEDWHQNQIIAARENK